MKCRCDYCEKEQEKKGCCVCGSSRGTKILCAFCYNNSLNATSGNVRDKAIRSSSVRSKTRDVPIEESRTTSISRVAGENKKVKK